MTDHDRPNWELVLRTLYEEEQSRIERIAGSEDLVPKDADLLDTIELQRNELSEAVQFLWDAGMLEPDNDEWALTEKGFSVAQNQVDQERRAEDEEKRVKRQNAVNRAIGFLTVGLLFVSWIEMGISGLNIIGASSTEIYWAMVGGTIGVLVVLFALKRSDLLYPERMLKSSEDTNEG